MPENCNFSYFFILSQHLAKRNGGRRREAFVEEVEFPLVLKNGEVSCKVKPRCQETKNGSYLCSSYTLSVT